MNRQYRYTSSVNMISGHAPMLSSISPAQRWFFHSIIRAIIGT
ncbi:hypothetical protein SAMN05421848_3098 [Kushneria avicenniae]|uniref:Uncharacterized protein n=1 Tax=Kushneria avicenniae TaxID=402385 RepID=A0A1I1MQV1_9GAMM|nr:hypothetical protein SAMN05421848_3098 [Kushneria avicenniae]